MDPVRVFRPRVEIDLDALVANYRFFSEQARKVRPTAEAAAVVKCDAYGLGASRSARRLAADGVRTFFVAHGFEGAELRESIGPGPTIYALLGCNTASEADAMRAAEVAPVLNTLHQAGVWRTIAASGPAPCALHVDTGMHRLGLSEDDFRSIAADAEFDAIAPVRLIVSHLANGFDPMSPENARQIRAYREIAKLRPDVPTSLAASGGLLLTDYEGCDTPRVGVGLYGVGPRDEPEPRLQTVARLVAPVLQIAQLRPGEAVGYGGEFVAEGPVRAATLAIGYGDGLPRSASGAPVMLNGARCPIIGRVSMDLTVIDASSAGDVRIGDEAEIFGPSAPIETFAAAAGTIAYEILTGLGPRLERRYVNTSSEESRRPLT